MNDQISVTAAYQAYGDMVLSRCRTLLRNDADATDACQEIFLQLHRAHRRYQGGAPLSGVLHKLTSNHCHAQLRSLRRRLEIPVEDLEHADHRSVGRARHP